MDQFDYLIVGSGMAGVSAAYFLAPFASVALLEMESVPAYHTTGRSAAFYAPTYGSGPVRLLTRASKEFLFNH